MIEKKSLRFKKSSTSSWLPQQLIESGEKERLMELLRERLIDCGWKDEMKALCRAFVKKKGRNNVTVDDLVHYEETTYTCRVLEIGFHIFDITFKNKKEAEVEVHCVLSTEHTLEKRGCDSSL
ncbi:hypothetical protein CsSME_00004914 [Camellia sinensis var. sinensis]